MMFTRRWAIDAAERCVRAFLVAFLGAMVVSLTAEGTVRVSALGAAAIGGLAAAGSALLSVLGSAVPSGVGAASVVPTKPPATGGLPIPPGEVPPPTL